MVLIVRNVIRVLSALLTMGIAVTPVHAQVTSERLPAIWGYGLAAPGVWVRSLCEQFETNPLRCTQQSWGDPDALWHAGGGVEWRAAGPVSVSGEAGALLASGVLGGLLSANGAVHLRGAQSAASWHPFISGGYSLNSDHDHGYNLGAGVNWWGRRAHGLRLDVRSHFWDGARYVEFRAGINFARPRGDRR